mmetsp:Transcript_24172/g.63470  ORF Transcript_24172/g.63470 Transcript_24172/m.63470 type:complete len:207 (-) Transcript_24172:176-796(-)
MARVCGCHRRYVLGRTGDGRSVGRCHLWRSGASGAAACGHSLVGRKHHRSWSGSASELQRGVEDELPKPRFLFRLSLRFRPCLHHVFVQTGRSLHVRRRLPAILCERHCPQHGRGREPGGAAALRRIARGTIHNASPEGFCEDPRHWRSTGIDCHSPAWLSTVAVLESHHGFVAIGENFCMPLGYFVLASRFLVHFYAVDVFDIFR